MKRPRSQTAAASAADASAEDAPGRNFGAMKRPRYAQASAAQAAAAPHSPHGNGQGSARNSGAGLSPAAKKLRAALLSKDPLPIAAAAPNNRAPMPSYLGRQVSGQAPTVADADACWPLRPAAC